MNKTITTIIETNDGITVLDAFDIIKMAMKEIAPQFTQNDDGTLEWDLSKNAPGYSVKIVDEGVGKPRKIIVGKAHRK